MAHAKQQAQINTLYYPLYVTQAVHACNFSSVANTFVAKHYAWTFTYVISSVRHYKITTTSSRCCIPAKILL